MQQTKREVLEYYSFLSITWLPQDQPWSNDKEARPPTRCSSIITLAQFDSMELELVTL